MWTWMIYLMPKPFYRRQKSPSMHWIGGWVGRASLNILEKEKFIDLADIQTLFSPVCSLVTLLNTLPQSLLLQVTWSFKFALWLFLAAIVLEIKGWKHRNYTSIINSDLNLVKWKIHHMQQQIKNRV